MRREKKQGASPSFWILSQGSPREGGGEGGFYCRGRDASAEKKLSQTVPSAFSESSSTFNQSGGVSLGGVGSVALVGCRHGRLRTNKKGRSLRFFLRASGFFLRSDWVRRRSRARVPGSRVGVPSFACAKANGDAARSMMLFVFAAEGRGGGGPPSPFPPSSFPLVLTSHHYPRVRCFLSSSASSPIVGTIVVRSSAV